MTASRAVPLLQRRYERLLHAYPVTWRARHGEVLLSVLLDRAEAEQRRSPTLVEALDLTVRGLGRRVGAGASLEVRARVASISVGVGLGFSLVYTALGLLPAWRQSPPMLQEGPLINLAAWSVLAAAAVLGLGPAWRIGPQLAVLVAPVTVLTPSWVDDGMGRYLPVREWALPHDANAAFLCSLAVLAALGPLRRRVVLQCGLIAAAAVAVGFVVAAGPTDDWGQTLWAATSRSKDPVPGTLQALVGGGSHRMLAAPHAEHPSVVVDGWKDSSLLTINVLPAAAVVAALVTGASLFRAGHRRDGQTVLVLCCPVLVALLVAVLRPSGIWFQ